MEHVALQRFCQGGGKPSLNINCRAVPSIKGSQKEGLKIRRRQGQQLEELFGMSMGMKRRST